VSKKGRLDRISSHDKYKPVFQEVIKQKIFVIRGHRIILDKDLAELYGVSTKALNQAVKRNRDRFPLDFAFRLTSEEASGMRSQFATASSKDKNLRSQNVTSSWGGRRYLPYVFTEYGALMTANVLNSAQAVTMSIYVIRAFVRLREVLVADQSLEERFSEIEKVLLDHNRALLDIFRKIKPLLLRSRKTDAIGFELTSPRPGKIG